MQERTLDEVSNDGGTKAGQETLGALGLDDLLETADQASVEGDGVKLDSGLHHIHGAKSTVGNGAADATGKGALKVIVQVVDSLAVGGSGNNSALRGLALHLGEDHRLGDHKRTKSGHFKTLLKWVMNLNSCEDVLD